jgi:hypothetical protein
MNESIREDKGILSSTWYSLEYASEKLKSDQEFLISLFTHKIYYQAYDINNLKYISSEILKNEDFMRKMMYWDPRAFQFVDDSLKNKTRFMNKVKSDLPNEFLEFCTEDQKNNKDFVLESFRKSIFNFKHVSQELKEDEEFIFENLIKPGCRKEFPFVMRYISEKLWNNIVFFKKILKFHPEAVLKNVSEKYFTNHDIVKFAIKLDFQLMKYFPFVYENDETMMEYLNIEPRVLKFASEKLKNDKKIVKKAFNKQHDSLEFASDKIRGNIEFMKKCVKKYGHAVKYAEFPLNFDEELAMLAIENNPTSLKYLPNQLKSSESLVLLACQKNGTCIKFAADSLLTNVNIIKTAFQTIPTKISMTYYVPRKLLLDRDFTIEMMKNKIRFWDFISARISANVKFRDDKEFIILGMNFDGYILTMANKSFQNKEFLIECCESEANPLALRYFNLDLFDDESIEKVLKIDGKFIVGIPDTKKNDNLIFKALSNIQHDAHDARYIFQHLSVIFQQDKSIEWKCMSYFKLIFDVNVFDLSLKFV